MSLNRRYPLCGDARDLSFPPGRIISVHRGRGEQETAGHPIEATLPQPYHTFGINGEVRLSAQRNR